MSRAKEEYESMVGGVLSHVYRREGDTLVCDPAELTTPLVNLLDREDDKAPRGDLEWLPPDLAELRYMARHKIAAMVERLVAERHEIRRATLDTFLNYLFQGGPDPLAVLERLFIYTRAAKCGNVWNMRQTEMAALFGHTKQNWQHKEAKLMEELVSRWSRSEFINAGGKSYSARLAYAANRQGNTNRKCGRHADDDMPPLPPPDVDDKPLSKRAKLRARLMAEDAEKRYVADLCDCEPDDIDLARISLPFD
jgi:hypothetical protein